MIGQFAPVKNYAWQSSVNNNDACNQRLARESALTNNHGLFHMETTAPSKAPVRRGGTSRPPYFAPCSDRVQTGDGAAEKPRNARRMAGIRGLMECRR